CGGNSAKFSICSPESLSRTRDGDRALQVAARSPVNSSRSYHQVRAVVGRSCESIRVIEEVSSTVHAGELVDTGQNPSLQRRGWCAEHVVEVDHERVGVVDSYTR